LEVVPAGWYRTADLSFTRTLLYQLSYAGTPPRAAWAARDVTFD
jgi:hypothetical protein